MKLISSFCAFLAIYSIILTPIMFFIFIIMRCCKIKASKIFMCISLGMFCSIIPLGIISTLTDPDTWCEHQYEIVEQIDATCKEKGSISKKCLNCGNTETEEIPLTHHVWNVTEEIPASCTAQGSKISCCSICNEIENVTTEIIPHTLSAERTEEATCIHSKQIYQKCNNCNYVEIESIGEPLPHSYRDWIIEKEPSVDSCGLQSKSCSVCQHRVTEEIKKISPITLLSIRYDIDSVGGVEWSFKIKSNSQKTIKYIRMYWNCYNAVDDLIEDEITGKTNYGIKLTGPFEYGQINTWRNTNKFYNHNYNHLKMTEVYIEFMDGTVIQITDEEYSNFFSNTND